MSRELFITTRQKIKTRNVFGKSMSTDIKLSKSHLTKIVISEWFLGALLGKLVGPLMKVGIPLATNFWHH